MKEKILLLSVLIAIIANKHTETDGDGNEKEIVDYSTTLDNAVPNDKDVEVKELGITELSQDNRDLLFKAGHASREASKLYLDKVKADLCEKYSNIALKYKAKKKYLRIDVVLGGDN